MKALPFVKLSSLLAAALDLFSRSSFFSQVASIFNSKGQPFLRDPVEIMGGKPKSIPLA
jgi:hypothetical protein